MKATDGLIEPVWVQLDEPVWLAAGVLAGLRRATNEASRRDDRDRGTHKNVLNDVMGAVTELVAMSVCESIPAVQVRHSLLDLRGPVSETTDLVLTRLREMRLETKGHFLTPTKRLLAINARAHDRSVRRGAEGYLPVITRPAAPFAAVGRIIDVAAVDSWDRGPLGSFRDEARHMPLIDAVARYFDATLKDVQARVGETQASSRELMLTGEASGYLGLARARREQLALPARFSEVIDMLASFGDGA
jgi:hypothetical protein